jgi:hypothetical protein
LHFAPVDDRSGSGKVKNTRVELSA